MNSAKTLLDLQAIDQKMAARRTAYRRIASRLQAEGDLKALRADNETARISVLEKRLEHSRLEAEVASLREGLEQNETRLYGGAVTNMRELTALEEEHSATKRNLARAEELVAPSRLAAQEARQQHEEGTERLATVEEEWKTTERELRIEAEVVGKECEELMEERVGTAADIDKSDLALYNSLLPRKSGIAVARVERGICQGCRIKLPMREMSRLKSSDRLVVCSSCGRILLGS